MATVEDVSIAADNRQTATDFVQDPRYHQILNGESKSNYNEKLSTFNGPTLPALENTTSQPHQEMSPQHQFQLLSQSIRRPDGSSNPDIDRVPVAKRSPGSGKSASSDQEDATIDPDQEVNGHAGQDDTPNIDDLSEKESKKDNTKKSSKNFSNIANILFRMFSSTRSKKSSSSDSKKTGKRSKSCDRVLDCDKSDGSSNFCREKSKSCRKVTSDKNIKSASSSPVKLANATKRIVTHVQMPRSSSDITSTRLPTFGTTTESNIATREKQQILESNRNSTYSNSGLITPPSMLSLVTTEWEFERHNGDNNTTAQNQNRLDNGNDSDSENNDDDIDNNKRISLDFSTFQHYSSIMQRASTSSDNFPAKNINNQINGGKRERKSSGYDSLEGDNSCLDLGFNGNGNVSNAIGINGNGNSKISSGIGNSLSSNNGNDMGTYIYKLHEPLSKPDFSNEYNQVYAELDEISRLKLEIGRHPDILNKNF